ncbi:MAG TPA: transporter substrate-binding domain-containing protein [Clostridiaceae bacterium]|nr:transporter substrate-binding domain-containing protein [Clostridiaceae bacterium]
MLRRRCLTISLLLICVLLVFSFASCNKAGTDGTSQNQTTGQSETQSQAGGTLKRVQETKKLVLGTSADYPPYEFHKLIDGKDKIIGFDIAIAEVIAQELGAELEIRDMDFGGLLMALQEGKVDIVIAGMTPKPERMEQVDFTKIYYTAAQGVVIRAEDKDKYKTADDLKGHKVGAQMGAIQEDIAKEQIPGSEVKALAKVSDLVLELKNKKVDALVMEKPVANAYIDANPDLALSEIEVVDDTGGSAIAIAKGNEDFVEKLNSILDNLINTGKIDQFVTDAINQVGD